MEISIQKGEYDLITRYNYKHSWQGSWQLTRVLHNKVEKKVFEKHKLF